MHKLKASLRGLAETVAEWDMLDPFRRLMGVEDGAYHAVYKQLNAKIVTPAVGEVNKTSNILVGPVRGCGAQADRRIFMSMIETPAARTDFERHGWMSALDTTAIQEFWQERSPEAFDDV